MVKPGFFSLPVYSETRHTGSKRNSTVVKKEVIGVIESVADSAASSS